MSQKPSTAIVSSCFPTRRLRQLQNQIPSCASVTRVVTSRKNYTRALTAIPTRAKWNDQSLHRHIDEHPQPGNVGLKLAPNVVGFTLRSDPIVNSVVEVCDGFGGLLMLRIRSGVELFQDEMSPRFYQRADPSQRIPEMG